MRIPDSKIDQASIEFVAVNADDQETIEFKTKSVDEADKLAESYSDKHALYLWKRFKANGRRYHSLEKVYRRVVFVTYGDIGSTRGNHAS